MAEQKEPFVTAYSFTVSAIAIIGVVLFILQKKNNTDYGAFWTIVIIMVFQLIEGIRRKEFWIKGKVVKQKDDPQGYKSIIVIYGIIILGISAILLFV